MNKIAKLSLAGFLGFGVLAAFFFLKSKYLGEPGVDQGLALIIFIIPLTVLSVISLFVFLPTFVLKEVRERGGQGGVRNKVLIPILLLIVAGSIWYINHWFS